jgi:hypothetical protein
MCVSLFSACVLVFIFIMNKVTTKFLPLVKLQKFVPLWYMIIIAALFIFVIDLCMFKLVLS